MKFAAARCASGAFDGGTARDDSTVCARNAAFSAGNANSLAIISICFDLSGVRKIQSKRQPLDPGGGAFTGEMAQKNRLAKISGKQGGERSCFDSTQKSPSQEEWLPDCCFFFCF